MFFEAPIPAYHVEEMMKATKRRIGRIRSNIHCCVIIRCTLGQGDLSPASSSSSCYYYYYCYGCTPKYDEFEERDMKRGQ